MALVEDGALLGSRQLDMGNSGLGRRHISKMAPSAYGGSFRRNPEPRDGGSLCYILPCHNGCACPDAI